MNEDKLAKKLLENNIPPQYIPYYEIIGDRKLTLPVKGAVIILAENNGFDVRFIKIDTVITDDFHPYRLNIHID